jgi:hypothetical protein
MYEKAINGILTGATSLLGLAKDKSKLGVSLYYVTCSLSIVLSIPFYIAVAVPFFHKPQVREHFKKTTINSIRLFGVATVGAFIAPFVMMQLVIVTIQILEEAMNDYGTTLKEYDLPYDEKSTIEYLSA